MFERTIIVTNESGMHARAASLFIQLASRFESRILVSARGKTADAKSILAIVGLGISKGTEIKIQADGIDEKDAVNMLMILVESEFGKKKLPPKPQPKKIRAESIEDLRKDVDELRLELGAMKDSIDDIHSKLDDLIFKIEMLEMKL